MEHSLTCMNLLLATVIASLVFNITASQPPTCEHLNKNMCEIDFRALNTDGLLVEPRLYTNEVIEQCPHRSVYNKCQGRTEYKCLQNDYRQAIEFCSPLECIENYTSCRVYFSYQEKNVFVWIEQCQYGYYPSFAYDTCHKDVKVSMSEIYPDKAFCDWRNGFFNKLGITYFGITAQREYIRLCELGHHCDVGYEVLPDGTCLPICNHEEHRTEATNFTCQRKPEDRTGRIDDTETFLNMTTSRTSDSSGQDQSIGNNRKPEVPLDEIDQDTNMEIKPKAEEEKNHWTAAITVAGVVCALIALVLLVALLAAVLYHIRNREQCKSPSEEDSETPLTRDAERGCAAETHSIWRDEVIDARLLTDIATCIGDSWEILAVRLLGSSTRVDHIKADNRATKVQIYEMLNKWYQSTPGATYETLREHLVAVEGMNVNWVKLNGLLGSEIRDDHQSA